MGKASRRATKRRASSLHIRIGRNCQEVKELKMETRPGHITQERLEEEEAGKRGLRVVVPVVHGNSQEFVFGE